jgi:hypothetical protein
MLVRENVVGQRIVNILGDSSLSDDEYNYTDFVHELGNGVCFRLPVFDETGDLLPGVTLSANHKPLVLPKARWWFFRRKLWTAEITDILIPTDPEECFPGTARIALSSGYYVMTLSGGPRGIAPFVDVVAGLDVDTPMSSLWNNT